MCSAAADVNLDGRVDLSDESAWLALLQMGGMNPVTGEPDRRMDLNGDGEVTEADFALWGPLFEQACKRPNEVGAMVDDGPFNGVAEGGVLTVPTRRGTWNGGTWVMHGVDNRFGFAGYMWDPFLKLYHVRHRVYDPMGGRWLQRDPIGMAGGWNLYQYCGGEPWGMVDPMGLWGWDGDWVEGALRAVAGALGVGDPQNANVTRAAAQGASDGFLVTTNAAVQVITVGVLGDSRAQLDNNGLLHDGNNPMLAASEWGGYIAGGSLLAAGGVAATNVLSGSTSAIGVNRAGHVAWEVTTKGTTKGYHAWGNSWATITVREMPGTLAGRGYIYVSGIPAINPYAAGAGMLRQPASSCAGAALRGVLRGIGLPL